MCIHLYASLITANPNSTKQRSKTIQLPEKSYSATRGIWYIQENLTKEQPQPQPQHQNQTKRTYFNNTNHDTSSDSNPDPTPDPNPDPDPEPESCDDPLDDPPSESKSESSSSTILRITPLSKRSRAKRRAGRRKWWLSRMPRVLRKRWVWWKRSGDLAFMLFLLVILLPLRGKEEGPTHGDQKRRVWRERCFPCRRLG